MRIPVIFTALILLLLSSCTSNSEYYNEIIGEWNCTSWVAENSTQDKCGDNAYFKFNEDRTYRSKLGSEEDKGTYKIERGKLMAQPEGKMVIGVKIINLDSGMMELLMNNGGVMETLKLKRTN